MEAETPGGAKEGKSNKTREEKIQDVLESLLSKKNLVRDQFLASKMNPQMYIPIPVLLSHNKLTALETSTEEVVAAASRSKRLGVDEQGLMVRPVLKSKRNVIILRDVPDGTTEEEIMALLKNGPHADHIVSAMPEVNNTWFVKYDVDDGTQDVVLWLRSQNFKGNPVNAAIKSEHFLRSFFPVSGQNLGFVPPQGPPNEGGFPDMGGGFPGASVPSFPPGGKGGYFPGHDFMPSAGYHGSMPGVMAPPMPPPMPMQFGLQCPGYWKPWGTRAQAPPMVFTSATGPAEGMAAVPSQASANALTILDNILLPKGKGKEKGEFGAGKGKGKKGEKGEKGEKGGKSKSAAESWMEEWTGGKGGKGSKAKPSPAPVPDVWSSEPLPWEAAQASKGSAPWPRVPGQPPDDLKPKRKGSGGKTDGNAADAPKMRWAVKAPSTDGEVPES